MPAPSCNASNDPRLVGDPVNTFTGAALDETLDFRLTGPIELRWLRLYDSSLSARRFALGWGHTHCFDRSLHFDTDGISYHGPLGRVAGFPQLLQDGSQSVRNGHVLRRVSLFKYVLGHWGEPDMEFEFRSAGEPARLKRLIQGSHEISFAYSAACRLESITDSFGRFIEVVEEADGRILSLSLRRREDERAHAKTRPVLLAAYEYDQRGNLVSTRNEAGHGFAFAYDASNRMVRRVGRKGFVFEFTYDSQGRCIKSAGDQRMHEVQLEYETPGLVTKVTRADGGVWTYVFDQQGALLQLADPLGGVQEFVKDKTGRVSLEVDPNGNATRIVYGATGAQVAKITPLGRVISLPEDLNDPDPLTHQVAANPAEYRFGQLLDLKEVTLPSRAMAAELPLPPDVRSLIAVQKNENREPAQMAPPPPSPIGPPWWPEPERGRMFNDLGLLVEQRDEWGRSRRWDYDASENDIQFVDFDGGKWSYERGKWHLLLALTNPMGTAVQFTYHPSDKLASCTDAGGTRSEYGYDSKDHLVEIRRHGVIRERYTRDAAGNLVAKHAADGRVLLQFVIGPGNLPVKRTLASGDEHTFEYDEKGRLLTAKTTRDSVTFAYDKLNNRCQDKRNGLGVEHRFKAPQVPAESVLLGRFLVRYEQRGAKMLLITDIGGQCSRILIHPHGLVECSYSNGSREIVQFDVLARCQFIWAQGSNGLSWSRRFTWSGEGELRQVEDSQRGVIRHEYDAAHRLRRRMLANGATEEHVFDTADNLLRQPGLVDGQLYAGNRLGSTQTEVFEYNDRNHMSVRRAGGRETRYTYDSRDFLIRVEMEGQVWRAEYDPLGRRTRKIWAGGTTEYYWDSDRLIAEMQDNGRVRIYLYAAPLALTPFMFMDFDSLDAPAESGRRYFIFTDQIGAPCLIEDESGSAVWRARYKPFGSAEITSRAGFEFNLRFPGHYYDAELGLHYNRFRYYDPVLGRYLQSDPWGTAGGYNLYAYRTNPLWEVDVRGLGVKPGDSCDEAVEGGQDSEATNPPAPAEEPPPNPADIGKAKALRDIANGDVFDYNNGDPRLSGRVADFNNGTVGASVKNLDLNGMTADQIGDHCNANGFSKTQSTLGGGETQDIYTHPDGGMVRVKPDGDSANARRPDPQASKSVRYPDSNPNTPDTSWQNEAFKVDNNGNAVPKSPGPGGGMQNGPSDTSGPAETGGYGDGAMGAAHTNLPPKTADPGTGAGGNAPDPGTGGNSN